MNDEREDILDEIDSLTNDIDDAYGNLDEAAKAFGEEQLALQDELTNFTVEQIEQQKAEAKNELQKEQKNAYADYQKQVNPYGVNAEQMAAQGMSNTGYSETSKVAMYTAAQNRIALARQSYDKSILDYNNAINEARMQNSVSKAQIAFQTLQMRLGYIIEGIGKKMSMLQTKASMADRQPTYLDVLGELIGEPPDDEPPDDEHTNDTRYELPEGMIGPVQRTDEEILSDIKNGSISGQSAIALLSELGIDPTEYIFAEKQKAIDDIKANGIASVETAKQRLSEFGIDARGHIMDELSWKHLKDTQPDNVAVNGIKSYHDYLTFITLLLLEQSL